MDHGAQLYKADLHVHTPGSADFSDRGVTAADIITAAVAAELDILGITDHNSAEWIVPLRKAAKGTRVTVIPGVEVTTPEGHVLGLFADNVSPDDIADLLVRVGIPRKEHGRETAISK